MTPETPSRSLDWTPEVGQQVMLRTFYDVDAKPFKFGALVATVAEILPHPFDPKHGPAVRFVEGPEDYVIATRNIRPVVAELLEELPFPSLREGDHVEVLIQSQDRKVQAWEPMIVYQITEEAVNFWRLANRQKRQKMAAGIGKSVFVPYTSLARRVRRPVAA